MTINKPPLRILFVCLGNICRSPAAEAVFAQFAANNNLNVELDSAGLSDWHEGEKADKRTRQTARERGYEVTSLSRPFKPHDFERFDMIIAMDDKNFSDLEALAANEQQAKKLYKMSDFLTQHKIDHIPDPYYGEKQDFYYVIDLLEDASEGLLNFLRK